MFTFLVMPYASFGCVLEINRCQLHGVKNLIGLFCLFVAFLMANIRLVFTCCRRLASAASTRCMQLGQLVLVVALRGIDLAFLGIRKLLIFLPFCLSLKYRNLSRCRNMLNLCL